MQPGLQERNFGKWESWDWPKISLELNKLSLEDRYTFRPPDGETWQEMEERLNVSLKSIAGLGYDSVAVVTHAGPIRVILPILSSKTRESTIKLVPALGECFVETYKTTAL